MTKPSRAQIEKLSADVVESLEKVSASLDATNQETQEAMASINTFIAIALRVFAKTNLSKLRSEFQTTEICARLDNKHVYE